MYQVDVVTQGYPGKSPSHGGLGWSTVALLRGHGETILVDTGWHGLRDVLVRQLDKFGVKRDEVTGVALSHCHWDHICNFPLFPRAYLYFPRIELAWALSQLANRLDPAPGSLHVPEFHLESLAESPRLRVLDGGDEFLPGLSALAAPGHTPGHLVYVARSKRGSFIFTGDAVKNQAELMTEQADWSLDPEESRRTIRAVRTLAAADPANVVVLGHDRLVSIERGGLVARTPLAASVSARLTTDFDDETVFDVAQHSGVRGAHAEG